MGLECVEMDWASEVRCNDVLEVGYAQDIVLVEDVSGLEEGGMA